MHFLSTTIRATCPADVFLYLIILKIFVPIHVAAWSKGLWS